MQGDHNTRADESYDDPCRFGRPLDSAQVFGWAPKLQALGHPGSVPGS